MKKEHDLQGEEFANLRVQMESLYTQALGNSCWPDSESAILEEIRNEDRYTMLRTIAEGGAKFIHLVEDGVTGRTVAMAVRKEVSTELEREGFLREARITSVLQHPNILPVYDMGVNKQQQPFFTMKYIEGDNLRQLFEQDYISLNDKIEIFYKVCEAVAYAHSCGVLHLDLKPENIQISSYGEVLICDWGLAEILDSQCDDPHLERYSFDRVEQKQNLQGSIKGTPGYMAPEQVVLGRRKDQRTDIFTLGAILFEIIANKPAISGTVDERLDQTEFDPTACFANNTLHGSLSAIACKSMQLHPDLRYQCMDGLITDLKSYRQGFATSAEEAVVWRHLQLFYRRHQIKVHLTLIFCLIVVLGTVFSFISIRESRQAAVAAHRTIAIEQKERVRLGREAAPRIFKQAKVFFASGDFAMAKERAETALMLDEESNEVRTLLGILFFLEKKYARAVDLLASNKTPLENKIRDLNSFYNRGDYTAAEERKVVSDLLLYCSRIMPSPLTVALCFHWIHDNTDRFLQHKAIASLKISHQSMIRVLGAVAHCEQEATRSKILYKVLEILEKDPRWLARRVPATIAMKLSSSDKMKKRFQALIPQNLALGQHVTSNGGDERIASYAVDGETTGDNFWAGNPFPAHITVDLNGVTPLSKFKVHFYYDEERYYQYLIQTSVDGLIYQTVIDQSKNTTPSSPIPFEHDITPVLARYVRLVVTHNSANASVHVYEFEVF